jgi:hypothetical protein
MAIVRDSFIEPPLLSQQIAELQVTLDKVGVEGECPRVVQQGSVVIALLFE